MVDLMVKTKIFETELAGFPITVTQDSKTKFTVTYGKEVKSNLNYILAAEKLGYAIFHALACEGKIKGR